MADRPLPPGGVWMSSKAAVAIFDVTADAHRLGCTTDPKEVEALYHNLAKSRIHLARHIADLERQVGITRDTYQRF